jgi:hypothetical protein
MSNLTKVERTEVTVITRRLIQAHGEVGSLAREDIMAAELQEDLDKLRTYEKLLPEEGINVQRLNLVIDFYRRRGVDEVASFLTKDQVVTLVLVGIAVTKATEFANGYLDSPAHDPLMLVSLNYMDRTDDMVELIEKRKVLDAETMIMMLSQMTEHHSTIMEGIL